jgi:hypothetical protein
VLKIVLDIGCFESNADKKILLTEKGEADNLLTLFSNNAHAAEALKLYTFSIKDLEKSILEIIENLKRSADQFEVIIFSPAFPVAFLVPKELFTNETCWLENMLDVKNVRRLHNEMEEGIINWYAVPDAVYQIIQNTFPSAIVIHAYAPLLKNLTGIVAESRIAVHFIHNDFRVGVKKSKQLTFFTSLHKLATCVS